MKPQIPATALSVAVGPALIGPAVGSTFQVRKLIPLMIRTRNITCWSPQQRAALKAQLRRLASISPYLIVLALPGSILMLPILVWWQERRRSRQRAGVLPRT